MACRLLSRMSAGPRELIEDGVNGCMQNPHDLPDIISKIETLMQNDKKYQAFSLNALEKSKQLLKNND